MPIECSITQPSGAVATYHVIMNSTSNFGVGSPANACVVINSYTDSTHGNSPNPVALSSMQLDISPLVLNPVVAAPSILYIIEQYLLTTPTFTGGSQVA